MVMLSVIYIFLYELEIVIQDKIRVTVKQSTR